MAYFRLFQLKLVLCLTIIASTTALSPPADYERSDTSYDWCDCRKGLHSVSVWPYGDRTQAVTVLANTTSTIEFKSDVSAISWRCDGMTGEGHAELDDPSNVWSMRLTPEKKGGGIFGCGDMSGRCDLPHSTYSNTHICI